MPSARSAGPADRYRAPHPAARSCFCYSIQALPEVGVLARLLEIFARRGLLPARLHSDFAAEREELVIDVQLADLEPEQGERMACAMRQIAGVRQVLTALKSAAEPLALSA
jgi:hypothetical protein